MVKPTRPTITIIIKTTALSTTRCVQRGGFERALVRRREKLPDKIQNETERQHHDDRRAFNGTCAGCGGDAGGSGGSDTAESKREAGVSAEDVSEDSAKDGGGLWVGLAGTLTGRLQWGQSILARALPRRRRCSLCTKDNQTG